MFKKKAILLCSWILGVRNMDRAPQKGSSLLPDVWGLVRGRKQLGGTLVLGAYRLEVSSLTGLELLQDGLEGWVYVGVSMGAPRHMAFPAWWSQGRWSAF